MGNGGSKIDDRKRAKIYRRVPLIEAKAQFDKLNKRDYQGIFTKSNCETLSKFPVSRNFFVTPCCNYTSFRIESSENIEVDGETYWPCPLITLLQNTIFCEGTIYRLVPKKYYIGLDKAQYDILYLTQTPSAIQTVS